MASSAVTAQGVIFKREGTTIPEIKSWSGPGGTANIQDVTTLQSTAKEKRTGLKDEGQLTLNINYVPDNAVHAALRADWSASAIRNFTIIFTDTATTQWDFTAMVTGFSSSGSVDGVIEGTVTLDISGSITES